MKEVADILEMHYMTVRQWCVDGKIQAQKIGRAWRITEEELNRLINEGLRDTLNNKNQEQKRN